MKTTRIILFIVLCLFLFFSNLSFAKWNSSWWIANWNSSNSSWETFWLNVNHGQTNFPNWWWNKLQNAYWELFQLKARISNNNLISAKKIMLKIQDITLTGTYEQIQERLEIRLNTINHLLETIFISSWDEDILNYIKLRLIYKASIYSELENIENTMTEAQVMQIIKVINNLENKYKNYGDNKLMYQYEKILWLINQAQIKNWDSEQSIITRNRLKNLLKCLEFRIYEKIEDLENS